MTSLLVVAGHDSSGRAGIDADRDAAEAFGCELHAVRSADTRQEDERPFALGARDPLAWGAEARAVLEEGRPAALKFGLLPGADHVRIAADLAREAARRGLPIVLDPVLASSAGHVFLDARGADTLVRELLPEVTVVTPNLPEAARLAGLPIEPEWAQSGARAAVARTLLAAGAGAVALKGGHGAEDPVVDLLVRPEAEPLEHRHPRHPGPGLRGSGCRYATALAAGLARGRGLAEAFEEAGAYLFRRMAP